jgi:hypothetical protein
VSDKGSGIQVLYSAGLTLARSTLDANGCDETFGCHVVDVENCSVADAVSIENSTIAKSGTGSGVGAFNCDVALAHATIVENAYNGVSFGSHDGSDELEMWSSIVADNGATASDCFFSGGILDVAGGENLDSDDSCGLSAALGDLPSTDPELGPFGYYQAPAPSYHPLPGSPVIDVPGACSLTRDQDNFYRPDGDSSSGGLCDLGSVEVLPCSSAQLDLWLPAGPTGSGTWEACRDLYAVGTVVEEGASVQFSARGSIRLDNGFTVGSGATFTATIDRAADWSP